MCCEGYHLQLIYKQKQMNFCHQIIYDTVKTQNEPSYYSIPTVQTVQEDSSFKSAVKTHQHTKRKYQKDNVYNWNDTQNRRYISFLAKQGHLLSLSVQEKKKQRVNVLMSKAVKSRTSTQCHTHHQKMITKYGSIQNIIDQYSYLFGKTKEIIVKKDISTQIQYQTIQTIEIVEDEQAPKESIWKQYLLPELFSTQEDFHDHLFTL